MTCVRNQVESGRGKGFMKSESSGARADDVVSWKRGEKRREA